MGFCTGNAEFQSLNLSKAKFTRQAGAKMRSPKPEASGAASRKPGA